MYCGKRERDGKGKAQTFSFVLGRAKRQTFLLNHVVVSGIAKINKSGKNIFTKYGCFVCNEHFFVYYANMQANACYLDDYCVFYFYQKRVFRASFCLNRTIFLKRSVNLRRLRFLRPRIKIYSSRLLRLLPAVPPTARRRRKRTLPHSRLELKPCDNSSVA